MNKKGHRTRCPSKMFIEKPNKEMKINETTFNSTIE